jgi:DtxR family Mn-dependent transcriptional regulator
MAKKQTIKLSESIEDYLETILVLSCEHKVVRVRDLAKELEVAPASVIGALKSLTEKGLVVHERYGYIELTDEGSKVAKEVYERHKTLLKFFHEILGIDENIARQDACRIEHYIDQETLNRIVKFIKFIETCPEGEPSWLDSFYHFAKTGKRKKCEKRNT